MIDLFLIALSAGIYIVPLYTLLQHNAEKSHKALVIASTNIFNALFMVVAAIVAIILLKAGLRIPEIFLLMGIVNLVAVVKIRGLLPAQPRIV